MQLALPIILVLILVVLWGLLSKNGLWNNSVLLLNVMTAALVSMNFFEPAAAYVGGLLPVMSNLLDVVFFWVLFIGVFVASRSLTNRLSKVKVRFQPLVDLVGGMLMAAWVSCLFVCLAAFSLHMAPLAREFLFGGFKAEQPLVFGFSPDRMWLGFAQKMSTGLYARGGSENNPEEHVFDPTGEFMIKYAWRREQIEQPRKPGT